MTADHYQAGVVLDRPIEPNRNLRRSWIAITSVLLVAVFVEAIFAGAMLSGIGWARAAHRATALLLMASAIPAGLVCLLTLRRLPHGLKLGAILSSLGALVVVQAALGAISAHGANLLWLHVPLGVALVGLAGQAVACARRLGAQ